MDKVMVFLENNIVVTYVAPIFILIVGEIIKLIIDKIRDRKIGIPYKVRRKGSIDIFRKYCERNRILPIISYGDSNALKVVSENDRGNIIVKAEYDLKLLPENNGNRNFVMILLKYIPKSDMSYFYRKGYSFMFDIKSEKGIRGIQLEIKDIYGAKVIDEFVEVSPERKHYSFRLNEFSEIQAWKEISEICFTVFTEKGYVAKKTGNLEICNCMLREVK